MMELNVQYNTRKQLLLKTLYTYVANGGIQSHKKGFSMFGTNSFHVVWEKVCAEIFDNQLDTAIGNLKLPNEKVPPGYNRKMKLIDLIEKPKWYGKPDDKRYPKEASKTLLPDIISIAERAKNELFFIIFDAKYYNMELTPDLLKNQPGIESISKQYLYQLAYQKFIKEAGYTEVRNCFLLPTAEAKVINKGYVELGMMSFFALNQIEVRLLPASEVYEHYLQGAKYDISKLDIFDSIRIINSGYKTENAAIRYFDSHIGTQKIAET